MSEYKLKAGKIGGAVVDVYQAIEDTVVGGYKKIESAFIDTFLEKGGGRPELLRKRLESYDSRRFLMRVFL